MANSALSFEVLYIGRLKVSHQNAPPTFIDDALEKFKLHELHKLEKAKKEETLLQQNLENREKKRCMSLCESPVEYPRERSYSIGQLPDYKAVLPAKNRTMLLQIGKTDLNLISLDYKSLILQKNFTKMSHFSQGCKNRDHFGFICKEDGFVGYIFKCESRDVVEYILNALKQAFHYWYDEIMKQEAKCSACPSLKYKQLCAQLEGVDANKCLCIMMQWIENLGNEEREEIMNKLVEIPKEEQSKTLKQVIKTHCEEAQLKHKHISKSEQVLEKARRSFACSLDQILKRVEGKDLSPSFDLGGVAVRKRASTVGSSDREKVPNESTRRRSLSGQRGNGIIQSSSIDAGILTRSFEKITELRKDVETRTRRQLMFLWRRAVFKQILISRWEKTRELREAMEKEAEEQLKLQYDPLTSCSALMRELWLNLLQQKKPSGAKLSKAVWLGVPQDLRSEVWHCLLIHSPLGTEQTWTSDGSYLELLKKLTSQQHVILLDVGRTFPSHPYFQPGFGPGQLALFNILKAYSLLDTEVGYCQGMGFLAAALLMHLEEEKAFYFFKHCMLVIGLRAQYLSDLSVVPLWMYQLSRVLAADNPALYYSLEDIGVTPALYAAPWFLSCFANGFPVGFVARVVDVLLLEGTDALFRICVAVMSVFTNELLACDGFETVVDFLKHRFTTITSQSVMTIFKKAESYHFKEDLKRYADEYYEFYQNSNVMDSKKILRKLTETERRLRAVEREYEELKSQVSHLFDIVNEDSIPSEHIDIFRALRLSSSNSQDTGVGEEAETACYSPFRGSLVDDAFGSPKSS